MALLLAHKRNHGNTVSIAARVACKSRVSHRSSPASEWSHRCVCVLVVCACVLHRNTTKQ